MSVNMARKLSFFSGLWQKSDFGKFNLVEPHIVSPMRDVPNHIKKPDYYETGEVTFCPAIAEIKTSEQIHAMEQSCKLASRLLKNVGDFIKAGMTTDDIDVFVHDKCIENDAYPSPLWYRGYPKSVCTSVNNVVCHGIPDSRPLMDGDIVNVDITVFLNGFHGDCSKTFLIGNVDEQGQELVSVAEECLTRGISICGPGVPFEAIGSVINKCARKHGFTVIPAFLGHGIGSYFHGPPDIYHTRNNYPGIMLPGMTFTIEPAITSGEEMIELLEDGWTAVTVDNARSAQVEHTILISENGHTILTE